jgi:hypothetical protein
MVANIAMDVWVVKKLKNLEYTRNELACEQSQASPIIDQDRDSVLALGNNFAHAWRDLACPMSLKKRLVRLLIHEVIADIDKQNQQLRFIIHWQGGCAHAGQQGSYIK